MLLSAFLTFSLPAYATGQGHILDVETAQVHTTDGKDLTVQGGAHFDDAALIHTAKELAALRAENEELKKSPTPVPVSVLVGLTIGILVGGIGTFYVTEVALPKLLPTR